MDLTSVKTIKEILLRHNARPSKVMGQHFLVDRQILDKIIKIAELTQKDTVLEIGPGIGTLTNELAKKAEKIIAVEKDRTMVKILKETLGNDNNVEIIQGDILKILNLKSKISNYKVVANIPYYLTSPIIRKFLENPPGNKKPTIMVLMVQKEVAQRICSNPPDMSILAVSVQFYAKAEIISYVSKKCFWPSPSVDSAIIKITPFKNNASVSPESFFKIVKAGFASPRKQLINNFSTSLQKEKGQIHEWLLKNNIQPSQRAETLSIEDWINLTNSFT